MFGYSLEVGHAHRDRVPADWIRRQSLANAERFVTTGLKELEEKILGAEERIGQIEERLYRDLLRELASGADRVAKAAASVAGARPPCGPRGSGRLRRLGPPAHRGVP